MPDTGAPWNIPYVAGTDLVSDYPTDSLALANAIASGLDAAGPAGIASNVVQVVKTDTFTTSSATPVTITGLSATITPTSASSKVLVIAQVVMGDVSTAGAAGHLIFTGGNAGNYVGDADGVRSQVWATRDVDGGQTVMVNQVGVYLDSPATTSATTYNVAMLPRLGRDTSTERGLTATPHVSVEARRRLPSLR